MLGPAAATVTIGGIKAVSDLAPGVRPPIPGLASGAPDRAPARATDPT